VGKSIGVAALACLPPDCQDRIAGFAINRFRGDISLLQVCDEASHGLHFFE
jgi:cobyric acid synthase